MKLRKILALTLALVLTFTALCVVSFAAEPADISTCTVEEVEEQKHTGSAITPDLVVKTAGDEPATLVKDTDYTVEFKNNTNCGTASYTITGKGNYTGTKTGTFEIVPNTPVDGVDYLDTDTKKTKDIDQKYSATVNKTYTDVSKVQVSWKIPDISATVTIDKKWNTETLTWDTTSTADSADGATAEFTLVNLSSVKVKADVAFTAEATYANAEGKTDKYTESYKVDDTDSDKAEAFMNSIIADRENAPETVGTTAPSAKIEYTITPQSGAFTHLTEAQTDAKFGTYTVKIEKYVYVTGVTLAETKQLTIDGAETLTATVNPSNATVNTVTWSSDAESVATVDKDGKVTAIAAGTAKITATAADGVSSVCTVTVVKKIPNVTAPTAKSNLTYNGSAQDLITAGSAVEGTLKYAVSDTEPTDDADYSESVSEGTNAGDYKVWYKSFGNDTYADSEAGYIGVSIDQKDISAVDISTPTWQTYTGSPIEPKLTIKDGEKTLTEGTDYTLTYSDNTERGGGEITICGIGNYCEKAARIFIIN